MRKSRIIKISAAALAAAAVIFYYYQKESDRLYKNGNERNGIGEDREHKVNYDDMGT